MILDPEGELSLRSLMPENGLDIVLAVGPEGGWSPADRDQLRAGGFGGLRLGPRILRTETAGLAAIAALQARLGDLEISAPRGQLACALSAATRQQQ